MKELFLFLSEFNPYYNVIRGIYILVIATPLVQPQESTRKQNYLPPSWAGKIERNAVFFLNVGTPSGVHLFDHLLWSILQSSITHYIKKFLQVLTYFHWKILALARIWTRDSGPPQYQADMLPTELSWLWSKECSVSI